MVLADSACRQDRVVLPERGMSTSSTCSSEKPKELYMIEPKVVRALISGQLGSDQLYAPKLLTHSARSTGKH